MRTLKTSEAAAVLNVSPNTLRAWERRFDFPRPQRSRGMHRIYSYPEIASLRDALARGLSISSAVSVAREAYGVDAHALSDALGSFRSIAADEAMESSLSLRTIERSVEEVLLPAIFEIRQRQGESSAAWAYASSWAISWLQRTRRLAPMENRRAGVLMGDASGPALDVTRPCIGAFELCMARAGMEVLTLPIAACGHLAQATSAVSPDAVVIGGQGASDEAVARWAYAVGSAVGHVPFLLFHRGRGDFRGGSRTQVLDWSPLVASTQVATATEWRNGAGSSPGRTA